MAAAATDNLDYLAARLHARRSRMAEGSRLDELCNLRTIPELSRAIPLEADCQTASEFQQRLVQDLAQELFGCVREIGGAGSELFAWMLARLQLENIKTLLRGFLNQTAPEVLQTHLVTLPGDLTLDVQGLMAARSLEDFAALLPRGAPRRRLGEVIAGQRNGTQLFFLEGALDAGYFEELLARSDQLPGEAQPTVRQLALQEANFFQFMLIVRGRFHFDLSSDALLALQLRGIFEDWFKVLLAAPDLLAAAKLSIGIVFDELPAEPAFGEADLEALAWKRYLRLVNGAFRRDPTGLGAVIGFAGLRRVETANLITLSEGIRNGLEAGLIRQRLIPRTELEVAHV